MPPRPKASRRRRVELSLMQRWDLELGIVTGREAFPSEEAAREAWEMVRNEYVGRYLASHPGKRPWAWWVFDKNLDRPREAETDRLFAMGEMGDDELERVRHQHKGLPLWMHPDCIR